MISFAFIITSVKFQHELISANIFLPMISCNELSITPIKLFKTRLAFGNTNSDKQIK